jgi:hypothetical protein
MGLDVCLSGFFENQPAEFAVLNIVPFSGNKVASFLFVTQGLDSFRSETV